MESLAIVDKAGKTSSQRLRDALAALAADGASGVPTASALCEIAGISRNALYRYHVDIVHELHKLQRRRHREPGPAKRVLQQLRDESAGLRVQVTQLAALVDHYFTAWQECNTLLQRRERELADLRKQDKKLASIRK